MSNEISRFIREAGLLKGTEIFKYVDKKERWDNLKFPLKNFQLK
jgi:hypothetical protein